MSSTTFVQFATPINADWLNDVNTGTYRDPDVFTATAGQTNFTLTATPPAKPKAFLNGLRLTPTTDYILSGTVLTLTSGATIGDELVVDY